MNTIKEVQKRLEAKGWGFSYDYSDAEKIPSLQDTILVAEQVVLDSINDHIESALKQFRDEQMRNWLDNDDPNLRHGIICNFLWIGSGVNIGHDRL